MQFPIKGGIYADVPEYIKKHDPCTFTQMEPDIVKIPFALSGDEVCRISVHIGDKVSAYQCIGEVNSNGIAYPVRASISGTVLDISECMLRSGTYVPSVTVKADHDAGKPISPMNSCADIYKLRGAQLAEISRQAGICSVPKERSLYNALSSPKSKENKIIINCLDDDFMTDARSGYFALHPEKTVYACRMIMNAVSAPEAVIVIDRKYTEAAKRCRAVIKDGENISVRRCRNKYPMNAQRIVAAMFYARIPFDTDPFDCGYTVIRSEEALALFDAVSHGTAYTECAVTVSGDAVKCPGNYIIPIGTTVGEAARICGFCDMPISKAVVGGSMSGKAVYSDEVPISNDISSIVFWGEKHADTYFKNSMCIRCGRCAEVCPCGLVPTAIAKNVRSGKYADNIRLRVKDCIGCGCCTYVCPGREPLLQYMNTAKGRLKPICSKK